MNFNSLISSRHREQVKYLLNLGGNVQQDFLSIPNSELNTDIPSTGDFSYGITLEVPTSATVGSARGLYGRVRLGTGTDRWGIVLPSSDDLRIINGSSSFNFPNISATYGGQVISVEVKYEGSDLVLFINDVEELRQTSITRPTTGTFKTYVGANGFGDSSDTPTSGRYFEGKILSFFFGSETWDLLEGNGFNTVSDLGTTAFGQTSNSGSLTYWNSTVWELE